MAGFYGTVFLQSLYFQQQRGYPVLATGLVFLPMTSLVALTNPLVGKIAQTIRPVRVSCADTALLIAIAAVGTLALRKSVR